MAKGKKKRKDLDFQKVKLKIGRRIKKDDRETKAEFSTRKIVIKEIRRYSEDPINALTKDIQNITHQGKISLLNHFRAALKPEIVKSLNKPIQDSLAKFILDQSCDVRSAVFKCLKLCFHHMKTDSVMTRDFVLSLKPYLDCAYTHLSNDIAEDCHKFIQFLVEQNEAPTFEPLMSILLARIQVGDSQQKHKEVALDLRRRYQKVKLIAELDVREDIETLTWTSNNNFIDLGMILHQPVQHDPKYDIELGLVEQEENVAEKFLSLIKTIEDRTPSVGPKKMRRF